MQISATRKDMVKAKAYGARSLYGVVKAISPHQHPAKVAITNKRYAKNFFIMICLKNHLDFTAEVEGMIIYEIYLPERSAGPLGTPEGNHPNRGLVTETDRCSYQYCYGFSPRHVLFVANRG